MRAKKSAQPVKSASLESVNLIATPKQAKPIVVVSVCIPLTTISTVGNVGKLVKRANNASRVSVVVQQTPASVPQVAQTSNKIPRIAVHVVRPVKQANTAIKVSASSVPVQPNNAVHPVVQGASLPAVMMPSSAKSVSSNRKIPTTAVHVEKLVRRVKSVVAAHARTSSMTHKTADVVETSVLQVSNAVEASVSTQRLLL